jgi:tRNA pseudouridine(55) synthase
VEKYATVAKIEGETPLQALEKFRHERGLSGVPLTYAGRLDPMAEGKLLILIGDECKKKNEYLGLDKEYEFEILFGLSSDTGDILGLVNSCEMQVNVTPNTLSGVIRGMPTRFSQPYPPYSSKTVDGEPLFVHARRGTAPSALPRKEVRIHRLEHVGTRSMSGEGLMASVIERIGTLRIDDTDNPYGDFRRDEVLERWRRALLPGAEYTVGQFRATVSSGTYIRSLAPLIADRAGSCGLAYSIRRTKIGRYIPLGAAGFWPRTY